MTGKLESCERTNLTQPNHEADAKMSSEAREARDIKACFAPKTDNADKFLPQCRLHDSSQTAGQTRAIDFRPESKAGMSAQPETQRTAQDVLKDQSASPEERLKAAQGLAHDGITEVKAAGADGRDMTLRINTIKAGANEMINVSMQDGNKGGILLKGIADGDGEIHHQKDRRGREADYAGSAKTHYESRMAGVSSVEKHLPQIKVEGLAKDKESHKKVDGGRESADPTNEPKGNRSVYDNYLKHEEERLAKPGADRDLKPSRSSNPSIDKIIDESASQARGDRNAITKTENGVYFRGIFDVDADGSPRARQIDRWGSPNTSLRYADGKRSSVNAEEVPYMVFPKDYMNKYGVKPGDMALVRNRENGRTMVAVLADAGPNHKRGEGSMALAAGLGVPNNPETGGNKHRNFDYLVLPNTGYPAKNQEQLLARMKALSDRLGLN